MYTCLGPTSEVHRMLLNIKLHPMLQQRNLLPDFAKGESNLETKTFVNETAVARHMLTLSQDEATPGNGPGLYVALPVQRKSQKTFKNLKIQVSRTKN